MSDNKTVKVSTTADLRTAIEAGYTKDQIEIVQPDASAAIATARTEGTTAGKAEGIEEGRKLGAQAERERINAINDLALEGFEKERDDALKAGTSPTDFAVVQAKAIKDRGVTVAAIKTDSPSAPHAAPGGDVKGSSWAQTIAKHGGKKAA